MNRLIYRSLSMQTIWMLGKDYETFQTVSSVLGTGPIEGMTIITPINNNFLSQSYFTLQYYPTRWGTDISTICKTDQFLDYLPSNTMLYVPEAEDLFESLDATIGCVKDNLEEVRKQIGCEYTRSLHIFILLIFEYTIALHIFFCLFFKY